MSFSFSLSLFLFFFYALYGLCIGSFLNVVIYRLPLGLPIAKGRSMCTTCHHPLKAADLVPLFSFFCLKGRCRYCGAPISWRYAGVESLTGVLFGLCGVVYGLSWYAVLLCLFMCVLVIAWFIDLDHGYLPDRLSIILLLLAGWSWFVGPAISIWSRLLGGGGLAVFMLAISYLTKGGIGGGDIKLMTASGLLLGWQLVVPAFFFAYILAAIRWLPPYLKKQLPKHFEVPMAPYFAIALMVFSLFGNQLIQAYLGLF